MLSPDDRQLLSSALIAPDGYAFEHGVGTTYGLDLTMLLRVPLFLALASEGGEDDGLELLESIERIASRLVVFAQAGHITTSGSHFRLYGLLEDCVVEAGTPAGSFHPKVWVLRFASPKGPTRLRLLVMSKNLTAARTWDIAVTLDATVGQADDPMNAPLADWLAKLPEFSVRPSDRERAARVLDLLDDVRKARWELPDGATSLQFHPLVPGTHWLPPTSDKLAIISPFVRAEALFNASKRAASAPVLVTREDELPYLRRREHGFDVVKVLHDAAEDSGEDATPDDARDVAGYGLHAKAYLWEKGDQFHIAAGSANATNAALLNGINCEFLVELSGPIGSFGSIDATLGPDALGSMLMEVDPEEAPELPAEKDEERYLNRARLALTKLPLELVCSPASAADDPGRDWQMEIVPSGSVELESIDHITAWPITASETAYAVDACELCEGSSVRLKPLPLGSVTTFIAFRLTNDFGSVRCVVNLPCELPDSRNAAIVTSIVSDRGAFMRYVRLLLHDPDDPESFLEELEQREASGAGNGAAGSAFETPILEELVRAYSRNPERLELIGRRIERIRKSPDADDIIPQEFSDTWAVFESALKEDRHG